MTTVSEERRNAGRPRALTVEAVVDAALALIERDGLSALSIRSLAAELGVMPRTVYTYVAGKDELLQLMADRFLERAAIEPPRPDLPWAEELARILRDYYRLYVARPHALDLLLHPDLRNVTGLEIVAANIELLKAAGFDARESLLINRALNRFVVGSAHGQRAEQALGPQELDYVHRLATQVGGIGDITPDDIFEHGLGLMLESLSTRASSRLAQR